MLIVLSNTPRDYAWGSSTLIAEMEGREPTGVPEAEVWFGDHAGSPALVEDGSGRTLDAWLAENSATEGGPARLPYLLKLLAAASPLSIQVHPSKAQAQEGFAREEAVGVARDASERNYKDDNHKPELIVAISERFEALAGLRDLDATLRLLTDLGSATAPLRARLQGSDPDTSIRETVGWLLSGDASAEVDAIIAAVGTADSAEFEPEIAVARRIAEAYPGDPGVVVALLMNFVVLRRGEGVYVRAGVLHAYLSGLGVELMAASDNVLRGGLTPKHIDVPELLRLLDTSTGPAQVLRADDTHGVTRYQADATDFALIRVVVGAEQIAGVRLDGAAIVLATEGAVAVSGAVTTTPVPLVPGAAVLATADEGEVVLTGSGEVFVAQPGVLAG